MDESGIGAWEEVAASGCLMRRDVRMRMTRAKMTKRESGPEKKRQKKKTKRDHSKVEVRNHSNVRRQR
jgi:hypothetical protein